ncbi:MAG: hypothetical protein LBL24_05285 [Bacteroidales bacterium]|jgi:hypothetical protein|nr:hypothetical protein [Bacteroidales bacterium]
MIHKSLFVIAFVALAMQGLTSCTTCSRTNTDDFAIPDSIRNEGELKVQPSVMEEMVGNISSPIEMASLVKSLKVPFSQKYLATTKNVSNHNTSSAKAFNLGIFGTDLGYLNMYGKTSLVLDYITAMKSLADGINVGQFFDFSTLKRLATNNQNIDSLVYISQRSFNKMDKYLQKNGRGNLSTLMIAGVWVEGLYLSAQFLKERPDEKRLAESIGEQKVILDQLMIILNNYKKEQYIADLIVDLTAIKEIYDGIRITIEIGEPKAIEVDGMLTIVQTETSTVHYTEEQMQAITTQAEIIRSKLIK